MTVNVSGVSASEVVEIVHTEIDRVREELTAQAGEVAEARLKRFTGRVLKQFERNEGLRAAFADPDFQFSLLDASRAAVSNDDEHTEDLLLELLTNRAEQGNEARVRLASSQAIRAADKLSLDALKGLTGMWALSHLGPTVPDVETTLLSIGEVANRLDEMGLPEGRSWAEDADALNLVRLSGAGNVGTRKPYRQILTERVQGYLNPGIDEEASRDLIAAAIAGCPWLQDKLQPHPLKPGFLVFPWTTGEEFQAALPPECQQSAELQQLVQQNNFGLRDEAAANEFSSRINHSPVVVKAIEWWDRMPPLDLTVVGTVIGFVNARRYIQFRGAQTVAELLRPVTT